MKLTPEYLERMCKAAIECQPDWVLSRGWFTDPDGEGGCALGRKKGADYERLRRTDRRPSKNPKGMVSESVREKPLWGRNISLHFARGRWLRRPVGTILESLPTTGGLVR